MAGQLIWRPGAFLVKQYGGPRLRLADRIVNRDVYRGPIALCESNALLRGQFGTGNRLGWVVTSSEVNWEAKGIGTLTINWEVGGPFVPAYLLPLDDWREETVELYPKIERHKDLEGPNYPGVDGDRISGDTIALCYQAVHGATAELRSYACRQILQLGAHPGDPPAGTTWAQQGLWGALLYDWLVHGHETYYLAGLKYCYIRHYASFPESWRGDLSRRRRGGRAPVIPG